MNPKHLLRLRQFTYGTCVVLWMVTIYLVKTGNFDFFSGLDWIVYFVTALAWSTAGTVILFWHHRRAKTPPRQPRGYQLNWTDEDAIFAPRESVFRGPYGEQDMGYWLSSQP